MDQLFTAKSRQFRLHRKSRLASKIKASISAKLPHFLGDYNEDVFLEYIIVLICNEKDQYQARDDLEAFLGEKSEEFVSWLWELLSEYNLDKVTGTGPPNSDRNKDAKVDRCTDFRSHINKLMMKGDKTQHYASDPASCKGDRRTQSKNQITQIVDHKCSGLLRERLHLPEREVLSKNTECSVSGHQFPTQLCAGNNSGTSLSKRSVWEGSICGKNSRGSVWDRLGKPCDEDISGGLKRIDSFGVPYNIKYGNVHNQLALIPPKSNSESPAFDKKMSYSYHGKVNKLEHVDTAESEPHFASNIGRKRLFGQISTCHDNDSALVDHSNMDPESKDALQNSKKSNVATNDPKSIQKQDLLDVKEKLNRIEFEMSKLRSKQVEFEKNDGKTNQLLKSGVQKDSEETFGSRTVLVTNVHFAATREALSLYFAKCGVVDNVMILTDTVTSKPKGSAYVTFASKESVDKAVALSGASFLCRTLKVLRTAGAAAEASAPTQFLGATSLNSPHGNRIGFPSKPHYTRSALQWRRGPGTVPSEHSCPAGPERDGKDFIIRAPLSTTKT